MTEDEIKAIITSTLKTALAPIRDEIISYVDQTAGNIRAEIPVLTTDGTNDRSSTADGDQSSPALLAVQTELQKLKDELKTKAESESNSRLESEVMRFASSKGVTAPGLLFDAVQRRFRGSLVEDANQWFFKDGESAIALESKLAEFLGTAEGKALLPPTGGNGSGSQETQGASAGSKTDPWTELAKAYTESAA